MKVLTIWILPIMVKSSHLQIRSFCFMVLISSSKFNFCFNRLSYVKCTPSILTNFLNTISLWKLIQFNAVILAQLPSNIISVFSSFILIQNTFRNVLQHLKTVPKHGCSLQSQSDHLQIVQV